jgi:hypothetical protein
VFNTTYRLRTGKAKWAIPSYTDNSLMGNNKKLGEVTLYTERELNIGTHIFRYIAEDKAGLKSTCEVRIMIKGKQIIRFSIIKLITSLLQVYPKNKQF